MGKINHMPVRTKIQSGSKQEKALINSSTGIYYHDETFQRKLYIFSIFTKPGTTSEAVVVKRDR